jgi:phage FluMu gp28-like protein
MGQGAGSLRRLFLVDNLDLPAASGVPGARWEAFQLAFLDDEGTFRVDNKSRQIAFSFVCAADGLAGALLERRDGIFVSINQEEAAEKIRYARQIYETLLLAVSGLPRVARDNMFGLEFENGARLTSLPARPPRGRARANVYLDEFAHVKGDRAIYSAALPIISKGGRLRMGSSPFGASGTFWEVFTQKLRAYPGYVRRETPWWETYAFCTDVRAARRAAPGLTTRERVERFGNRRVQEIFENVPEEDFAQEYECAFVDETTAWITWEEIREAQDEELVCVAATGQGKTLDGVYAAVDALRRAVNAGEVEGALALGVDIGRTRNTTEIYGVGLATTKTFPLRLMLSLDGVEFDEQLAALQYVMRFLPVAGMWIDRTGLGMPLAERMERLYPGKAQGQTFTAGSKMLWATDAKLLIQQRRTPLPVSRELAYQIHSIKRMRTAGNNLVFDTETNEKHHADRFWAWALALGVAYGPQSDRAKVARAR